MGRIPFNPISKKVAVGGRDFTVSALPLGVVRYKLWPLSDDLAQGRKIIADVIDDVIVLILASVAMVEPEITQADIEEGLLLTDIWALFREVGLICGMRRADAEVPEGEEKSPENTGPASTGSSSLPPDGTSTTSMNA
jgi:hypothetical protein